MEFNLKNVFSIGGIFIITVSFILSYIFVSETKRFLGKRAFSFFLLIPTSIFIVMHDERKDYIKELRSLSSSSDIEVATSALYHLASIYEYEGDIGATMRTYMEIIRRDPHDDRAMVRLAVLLIHTGKVELAVPLIEQALSLNPENKDAKMLKNMLSNFFERRKKGKNKVRDEKNKKIEKKDDE